MPSFLPLYVLATSFIGAAISAPTNGTTHWRRGILPYDFTQQSSIVDIADPPTRFDPYAGSRPNQISGSAEIITDEDDSVQKMIYSDVAAYRPFTHIARVTDCPISKVATWTCGSPCLDLPGMEIFGTGGNEDDIPDWWVAYWPDRDAIVVSHQGTNFQKFKSILIDIEFRHMHLNKKLFPDMPHNVKVHSGFSKAHERTASEILELALRILEERRPTQVISVGHSLGGALAQIEALFLKMHLPKGLHYKVVTYGGPRVGNDHFADYYDEEIPDTSRINNMKDPVPTLPGRLQGYRHTGGEKHIEQGAEWYACDGHDNTADVCSTGEVKDIFDAVGRDHAGPYDAIMMECE